MATYCPQRRRKSDCRRHPAALARASVLAESVAQSWSSISAVDRDTLLAHWQKTRCGHKRRVYPRIGKGRTDRFWRRCERRLRCCSWLPLGLAPQLGTQRPAAPKWELKDGNTTVGATAAIVPGVAGGTSAAGATAVQPGKSRGGTSRPSNRNGTLTRSCLCHRQRPRQPRCFHPICSRPPIYGRSTSGTTIEPSACW